MLEEGKALPTEARAGGQPQQAIAVLADVPDIAGRALANPPGGVLVAGQAAAQQRALHGARLQGDQQQQARQQR
ncbi:hypothetical protein G6F23_016050 [Rhizopus arrhizus]|nr:hypothetical protein G6F23_016050 [Rhizopus arrhizus]